MKKILVIILAFLMTGCTTVAKPAETAIKAQGTPRIILAQYATDDVVIADRVVTEEPYNADAKGSQDCTAAFQKALNDCYESGGGVVWAPAGRYKFTGSLTIPEGVTLRGDWKKPTDKDRAVGGTILMPYAGKGRPEGKPFINITGGSGVNCLNIYYPEQSISDVIAYPPSIQTAAVGDGDHTKERAALNVRNVTFVNSYVGVLFSYYDDASSVQFPYVKEVYGTPLKTGVKVSRASAFPRTQGVNFAPEYWAQSGLEDSPSASTIASFLQGNNSVAIDINGNGSGDVSDAHIKDYSIGVYYSDQTPGGSNGKLFGSTITGANKGVSIGVSDADIFVVSCNIEASVGKDPTAVFVEPSAGTGTVYLNNCTINSTGNGLYNCNEGYNTNVQNCTFEKWGSGNGTHYAIESGNDIALIEGNKFNQAASAAKKHIQLGKDVTNAVILGNKFNGSPLIDNKSEGEVDINHSSYTFQELGVNTVPKREILPKPARTDVNSLFNVKDYGAKGDGKTDDTSSIQAALDAAGAYGGGTVYIPGGKYCLYGHLKIPAGVELRGAQQNPFFVNNVRCILYVYSDKNNQNGEPLIKLISSGNTGSGIKGVFFWYPEQEKKNDSLVPYPYAIQSQGPNCWVTNVAFGNAYNGVDFGAYDSTGHYIEGLAGYAGNNMLKVSKSSGGGFIANLQTNPTFWKRGFQHSVESLEGKAPSDEEAQIDLSGAALILGNVVDEKIMGCFTHGPQVGIHAVNIDGGGPEATVVNSGGEVYTWLKIDGAGQKGIRIVNGTWHTNDRGKSKQGQPYMIVSESVGKDKPIQLFSCMNWADTEVGMDIKGGNVLLQQYSSRLRHVPYAPTTTFAKVSGGILTMENARFTMDADIHAAQSGSGEVKVAGSVAYGGLNLSGNVDTTFQPNKAASTVTERKKKEGERKEKEKKDKVK